MKKTRFCLKYRYTYSSQTCVCSWLFLYLGRPLNPYTKLMLMFPESEDKIMVVSLTTGFPCRNRAYSWSCSWWIGFGCIKLQATHWNLWSFFCPHFACNLGNMWTKTPDLKINICAPGVWSSAQASSIAWYVLRKGWRQPLGKTGHHTLGFMGILF